MKKNAFKREGSLAWHIGMVVMSFGLMFMFTKEELIEIKEMISDLKIKQEQELNRVMMEGYTPRRK